MKEKCLRDFAKYTSLNVLGMIGLSCYILADTFFVSKGLGTNGLAALNLAIPVYSFIHGSGLMIGMGGGIRYAIEKSQKNHTAANRTFTGTIYLAGAFAAIFTLAGIFLSGTIVSLFGADKSVYDMSKTYLQVILLFAPAFLLNNVLLCFVRNDGAPQLSMAAMIGGSLSNIVLDWVFIFPCRMGIFGAAFATGLAPIISILILSPHLIRRKNQFHLIKCRMEGKVSAVILSGGVPSLVTEVSSGVVMIVFNSIILRLEGNVGVAAYGVIANLSLVIMAIYTGIAQGIQPIVSRGYGKKDIHAISTILCYAIITMLVLSAAIYTLIFLSFEGKRPQYHNEIKNKGSIYEKKLLQAIKKNLFGIITAVLSAGILLAFLFSSDVLGSLDRISQNMQYHWLLSAVAAAALAWVLEGAVLNIFCRAVYRE